MCGIVGYVGKNKACNIILDGLKNLEYRGYDSAGVAIFNEGKINIVKSKGRLENLIEKLNSADSLNGISGIGHTRWATHGEPSDMNSHPHGSEKISIVHNGIIENYLQLKEYLHSKGYTFDSETDTEVVAKLLDHYYDKQNPLKAIHKVASQIKGSYALGIIFNDMPNTIYAIRKDSPLIVGVGNNEYFIASDAPAILKYTKDYYLLEEDETAILNESGITILGLGGEKIEKELHTVSWDIESAEKGGYPHFMLKEIYDQPHVLRKLLNKCIEDGALPDLEIPFLNKVNLDMFDKITIVGCGTAMYAGIVGKYIIEDLARISVDIEAASEFRYRNPMIGSNNLVIIMSQSGETADTLAALRLAKSKGAFTLGIVNVVGSSIAREADSKIYTHAGLEIAVASTKAYSAQLAVLYMLAIQMAVAKDSISESHGKTLANELKMIPSLIEKGLEDVDKYKFFASKFQNAKDLFFIGRGLDYALSLEGSLKLKEISYIHSDAYAAGELKHGTISLIEDGVPVIAIATQEALYEKMVSNIKEVSARGAKVLLICKKGAQNTDDISEYTIELDNLRDIFMPLTAIIPLQLFAYYTAVLRGCDVDKPRNLAKSVTVE